MKYLFSTTLFTGGVLALYFAVNYFWSEEKKYIENKLLALLCLGSSIWSFGYSVLIMQTDPQAGYLCRAVGMAGVILYLITAAILVCQISGIPKGWVCLLDGFAFMGIFVYFLTIDPTQSVFYPEETGMTYHFLPGLSNTLYTAYSLLLCLGMLGVSLYMVHFSKVKRIRSFGVKFLLLDALMLLGTVLDTVFPMLGLAAIPGSSLTQFWGMVVISVAIRDNNRSKINIKNMSEFIYYSLSVPVLVYDSGYRLQLANDAAADFLHIHQQNIPSMSYMLHRLFEVDGNSVFVFDGNCKNIDTTCKCNQIYCNLAINKIHDRYDDTIGYIIILTDLSERVRNMQKLREAKQEAEAANIAKSAFLANMSHEIRTPMNAIMGFSELILKMDISDKVRGYAADIKSSSQNLLSVINDILDISKLDSGKMKLSCSTYYTSTLLLDAFHLTEVQAKKKGLLLEMNADPQLPHELYGDTVRLRSILINLLNNAVKYTKEGSITFNARVLKTFEDTVTLEFSISDTGIGIDRNAKEHLFDSFTQFDLKKNAGIEGTGLGLAIVNGYVRLMNGTIRVDSIYGQGSTFTVTLNQKIIDPKPLECLSVNTNQSVSALNSNEIKIRNARVLVTDDNLINLKVIRDTLASYGFTVDTASDGEEAISLCRHNRYTLVFMDQMMPRMDGIETMERIRSLSPYYARGGAGKIIVLTANAIAGTRKELMEKGFDEYLAKPVDFRELERILLLYLPPAGEESGSIAKGTGAVPRPAVLSLESFSEKLLPEIDIAAGIEHCGGNADLYLKILQILNNSSAEHLSHLKAAADANDLNEVQFILHTMKGELLTVGCRDLANTAAKLELSAKNGLWEDSRTRIMEFNEAYEEMRKKLDNVLKTLN